MENVPLQVYASALVFSPRESQIRRANLAHYPTWFKGGPVVEDHWGPLLQILEGHNKSVMAVAYSFDGRFLASLSEYYQLFLWDTRTGTLHSRLFEGIDPDDPNSTPLIDFVDHVLTFSSNGQLACVSSAWEVRVWEPVTGTTCRKLVHDENREIQAVAFAPDGTLAISYKGAHPPSYDGARPQTWIYKASAVPTETKVGTRLKAHPLSFLSDGTLALLCSIYDNSTFLENAGELVLYNPETRVERSIPVAASVHSSFSSNGLLALLSSSRDYFVRVHVYDLTTGEYLNLIWKGHDISTSAFSINNTGLFVGCFDGSVHYLDLESGTETFTWTSPYGIQSIAPSPGGKLAIASSTFDRGIRIVEVGSDSRSIKRNLAITSTGTEGERPWGGLQTPLPSGGKERFRYSINSIVFSRDGRQLACATFDNIYVIDPATGRKLSHLQTDNVTSITINGNYLASGHFGGTVRVWDLFSGRLLKELRTQPGGIYALAFSPDNRVLVSVDSCSIATFWDSYTWGLQRTLRIREKGALRVNSAAFSHNGKRIAFLTSTSLEIWNAERYTLLQIFYIGFPSQDNFTNQISIFVDDLYIDTTFGRVGLDQSLVNSPDTPDTIDYGQYEVEDARWRVYDNWLFHDGQKLLWLPLEFRSSRMAMCGDLLAMSHASGKVTLFDGNTNDSKSGPAYETSGPGSRNKGKRKAPEYFHHRGEGARISEV